MKLFLLVFIITLTSGVLTGLVYLYHTTEYSAEGAVERYNGSGDSDQSELLEYYPKPVSELFMTTHNHIISFSFIFFFVGGIFYFNSVIGGIFKQILIIEPFISTIISFGSLWGMRFLHENFVYVTVVSSSMIYLSYFTMAAVIIYELAFKKQIIYSV